MGLFREFGRRVERFKRSVEEAADDHAPGDCESCGEPLPAEAAECPSCGESVPGTEVTDGA